MIFAQVKKILELNPIDGADRIEMARVNGWDSIVVKGQFQVGDLCVFVFTDTEVDTSVEPFVFLDRSKKGGWTRIKTEKMRGVYSQGVILNLSCLPQPIPSSVAYVDEQDVSDLLPIRKYVKGFDSELAQRSSNLSRQSDFPTHLIRITDEDNAKSNLKAFNEFKGLPTEFRLKMDGSSLTLICEYDGQKDSSCTFQICSRRFILTDDTNVMVKWINEQNISQKIISYCFTNNISLAIQGEFVGPKVNGNVFCYPEGEYSYYVFNVKDLHTQRFYSGEEIERFCGELGLKQAPLLQTVESFDMTVQELQKYANTLTYNEYIQQKTSKKNVPAEGVVIRPKIPVFSQHLGKNLSLKIINQEYKD